MLTNVIRQFMDAILAVCMVWRKTTSGGSGLIDGESADVELEPPELDCWAADARLTMLKAKTTLVKNPTMSTEYMLANGVELDFYLEKTCQRLFVQCVHL
jgi:hypothetical protein